MSVQFSADEVYQMAEQIERNGARFYRTVAARAGAPETGDLLRRLAAMEDDHERVFADLRTKLTPEAGAPMVFDPEGDAPLYLQAMAGGYVFDVRADPSAKLSGRECLEEVLQIAVGAEKDSVVFYESMKAMVPEEYGQASLERIIKEELGHIATLGRMLAERTTSP